MATLATTKMSSKGQVVIPEDIRKRLNIKVGAQFVVVGEKDVIIFFHFSTIHGRIWQTDCWSPQASKKGWIEKIRHLCCGNKGTRLQVKVIVDTNVFISGVFFSGPPHQILNAWRDGKIQWAISQEILKEYWLKISPHPCAVTLMMTNFLPVL